MAFQMLNPTQDVGTREIVFIDTAIHDYQTLLAGLRAGIDVVLIDASRDGLAQIAAALAGRGGIDAVHIVSHGSEGVLALGSGVLDTQALDARGAELDVLRAALGAQGDILLYGCEIGAGDAGARFLGQLAERTGAAVAASDDRTGASALGGNWVLERHIGDVAASSAFDGTAAYAGVLAVPADQNFDAVTPLGMPLPSTHTVGFFTFSDPGMSTIEDAAAMGVMVRSGNALFTNVFGENLVKTFAITGANNFDIKSMRIETHYASYAGLNPPASQITVRGYLGGSMTAPVAEDTVNLTQGDTAGSVSFSLSPSGSGGMLRFIGAAWRNVDTIVISTNSSDPLVLVVDVIDVEAVVDAAGPAFVSAAVTGSTLVMQYADADTLQGAAPPMASAFTVTAGGAGVPVNAVAVDPNAKTVTLTLASAVAAGQAVTVAYLDPTAGNDVNAIQDASGNDAASLAATSVANMSPDTTAPAIAGVAVPSSGSYKPGQVLAFTVNFDENLVVTGTGSTLELMVGASARSATYAAKTASSVSYHYTVQAGDLDADGVTLLALALNGSTIRDAAGNDAVLALNAVGSTAAVLVDGIAPAVSGYLAGPASRTYGVGDTLSFTVGFDEHVAVSGTASTLGLDIGGVARSAAFASKTANSVTYSYTVQAGDKDADGIAVGALALGGDTIRDAAGNDASLALAGHLPALAGVLVDAGAPAVSGIVTAPANGSYGAGQVLSFTVHFDENLSVTGTDSTLGLRIGAADRSASFVSASGNALTYAYTVQAGDNDANGITVGAIALGSSTIRDATGNDAALSLAGHLPSLAGVLVDTGAPEVASVAVPASATYAAGQHLDFTVSFDEDLSVTGAGSTLGLTIGAGARSAAFLAASGNTVTYRYTVQAGDLGANGVTVGTLALNGASIRDAAGNDALLVLNAVGSTAAVLVDGRLPAVAGMVAVPAGRTYAVGDTLSFTVGFDEDVAVSGTASTLGLDIGGVARSAAFASKTANSVTYAYTVQAGDEDADGIAVGALALGGDTIRDAAGNDASLALAGHLPALAGVLVDTGAPVFGAATVNGATLVLRYADAGRLDAAHGPAAGAFTVSAGAASLGVTTVALDAAAKTVTLTLASAVAHGQVVTVAYADPTAGNDAHAIQDAAGNDAASLAPVTATNTTAPPAPAPDAPVLADTVDGAPVLTSTSVRGDGMLVHTVTVPVVTSSRPEQVGDSQVADIPLVKDGAGASLLTVQVPAGTGLQASGTGPRAASASLEDLIREIRAHTAGGSQAQDQMTGGASGFLGDLAAGTPLLVQTIALSGNGGAGAPLTISSQPQDRAPVATALVIDTRALPEGAALALQNVEFAAVIGAATVTGGAGAQRVWGDDARQTIFLGADDDVLHGGGGNDVVGSAGGNDRIYGDAGDDIVFGGAGDDYLDGGSGRDVARFDGRSGDYSLRVKDGLLVLTDRMGQEGTDTVAAVEVLRFAGGQGTGSEQVLARLYEGLLQRPASAAEVAYWHDRVQNGMSLHDVGAAIIASDEGDRGASDAGFVAGLYQSVLGRTATAPELGYWAGQLERGADRAGVALAFVNSTERLAAGHDLEFIRSDVAILDRMYQTMFGRSADEAGMNYWLAAHEGGMSWGALADAFAASAEGQGRPGGGDDAFIGMLYQNALGRAPTAAEQTMLLEQLQHGVFDRGQVLLNLAESADTVALIGLPDSGAGLP